jgi:hypothetical protein
MSACWLSKPSSRVANASTWASRVDSASCRASCRMLASVMSRRSWASVWLNVRVPLSPSKIARLKIMPNSEPRTAPNSNSTQPRRCDTGAAATGGLAGAGDDVTVSVIGGSSSTWFNGAGRVLLTGIGSSSGSDGIVSIGEKTAVPTTISDANGASATGSLSPAVIGARGSMASSAESSCSVFMLHVLTKKQSDGCKLLCCLCLLWKAIALENYHC